MLAPIELPSPEHSRGLTLLELLLVLAIVAVLLSLALPSYQGLILSAQRSEVRARLLQVATLQIQYRIREGRYAANLEALGLAETLNGRYRVQLYSDEQGRHWQARAEAIGQQAADQDCLHWFLDDLGQRQAWDVQGEPQARCW